MQNKVVKNAIWIIACRIVQAVLSLVVTMLSARYLGPSGYGIINYASSLVAFIAPVMKLGLDSVLVQSVVNSPDKEGKIMGTGLTLSFISGLFCILGILCFTSIANAGDKITIIVCLLYSISLIFQGLELIQYYYQAKLKSKYHSVCSLIAYTLVSAYKIVLLLTGMSVYWFAISSALDFMIISVLLIIIYKKVGTQKLKFSFSIAKELLKSSKYFILSGLMVTIFANTDRIMINLMLGKEQTGYYSSAVATASMVAFVFVAIIDSARPQIYALKKISDKQFERGIVGVYSVVIYLSLAVSLVITLLAPLIIEILFGEQYYSGINSLRIIVWYTTFSYIGAIRDIWLLAEGKQKYLWIINLSGASLNIILNFIFIPIWGIEGAAFASLLTQIFTNVVMSMIIKPVRRNNLLMSKGLNPKHLWSLIKNLK